MTPTTDLSFQGVHYSPSSVAPVNNILDDPENRNIRFVRVQWVDLTNTIRYRVVPLTYFRKLLRTSRPGVGLAKIALGLVFISIADGFGPIGEYLYAIDSSSLRICHYAPGHASVMGWFQEKEPLPISNADPSLDLKLTSTYQSIEVDLCPRTILKRIISKARALGIQFLIGFESEFILVDSSSTSPSESITAVNSYGWSVSSALLTSAPETLCLEDIASSLLAVGSGVELQMYHAEAAPGQYEVVTGPMDPLAAVDALIHTRETIFNVARKYGLKATFAPRVYKDNCGSATHTHISVHPILPSSPSLLSLPSSPHPNILPPLLSSFLSGLLTHLPSITLPCLPLPASYLRMQDGVWSGGTYVCWGVDNKEAPVRLCNSRSEGSRNIEIKAMDGTANPYIAVAAMLGAGMEGVKGRMQLTVGNVGDGEAASGGASELSSAERERLGITQRFPLNLEEARKKFSESTFTNKLFGEEFVRKYLAVNKQLATQLTADRTETDQLKFLIENY